MIVIFGLLACGTGEVTEAPVTVYDNAALYAKDEDLECGGSCVWECFATLYSYSFERQQWEAEDESWEVSTACGGVPPETEADCHCENPHRPDPDAMEECELVSNHCVVWVNN